MLSWPHTSDTNPQSWSSVALLRFFSLQLPPGPTLPVVIGRLCRLIRVLARPTDNALLGPPSVLCYWMGWRAGLQVLPGVYTLHIPGVTRGTDIILLNSHKKRKRKNMQRRLGGMQRSQVSGVGEDPLKVYLTTLQCHHLVFIAPNLFKISYVDVFLLCSSWEYQDLWLSAWLGFVQC